MGLWPLKISASAATNAADGMLQGFPLIPPEQMEAYCHQVNRRAPYLAELYLCISQRLGLRGDLAYAQALYETGYFRFGGDVAEWQNNFAGLGATGGVSGAVFDTPAEGVLAHLQHLYAYATLRPLPPGMRLADPRFQAVSAGSARTITDLNGRWAVPGDGYGEAILAIYRKLQAAKAAPWTATARADAWRWGATLAEQYRQERQAAGSPPSAAPGWLASQAVVVAQAAGAAYSEPDAESDTVAQFDAGDLFPAFFSDNSGQWYRVTLPSGQSGWVAAEAFLAYPSWDRATDDAVVVLDAGHGGEDTGTSGPSGALEKDLTLAIVLGAAEHLGSEGVQVWLTRNRDADVDLRYRSDLANAAGADCFISFHLNGGPPKSAGTETYWQCGGEQAAAGRSHSQRLACLLQSAVLQTLASEAKCPSVARGVLCRELQQQDRRDYYHVLREAFVPAALVEGLFLTNPAQETCLLNATTQQRLAGAVAKAVLQYLDPTVAARCQYAGPIYGL